MGDAGEPPLGLDETTKYDWEPAPPATLFKEGSEDGFHRSDRGASRDGVGLRGTVRRVRTNHRYEHHPLWTRHGTPAVFWLRLADSRSGAPGAGSRPRTR